MRGQKSVKGAPGAPPSTHPSNHSSNHGPDVHEGGRRNALPFVCLRPAKSRKNHRNDAFPTKTMLRAIGYHADAADAFRSVAALPPPAVCPIVLEGAPPVVVPPLRLIRFAARAVFATTTCVTAALAIDASHFAAAQGRLEAEYSASVAGIPIGRGSWVIDISDDQFIAAASGATSGLLKFITGVKGSGISRGFISGGQLAPTSYTSTIDYGRIVDDVRIALAGGNVKDYSVAPPLVPHPERIPVRDEDRRGVVDPMTSTLSAVAGNADLISPLACNRKVGVFDGRLRYDLQSEFKRIEMVKAEKGYQGPAVVCAVYFMPISGYVPGRPIIKYLIEQRDAEVWLVPISGTRVMVPFRFSLPTPIGFGVVEATHFYSVAAPRSNATAKVQ
jgi:Protein of unknown function (DUF3108)